MIVFVLRDLSLNGPGGFHLLFYLNACVFMFDFCVDFRGLVKFVLGRGFARRFWV